MKKLLYSVLITAMLIACCAQCETETKIQVLLLPKFEVGEMSGDAPGEAQYYYDAYCKGGEAFDIAGGHGNSKLYVKDGVALYVTGMGKVNASLSAAALLSDSRFDFTDAYVISTGCAGAAYQYGVMGDVYVISAVVDYDLGHHVDCRDMAEQSTHPATWYHDDSYDDASCKILNPELTQSVYNLVKDVQVHTTERTQHAMVSAFPGEQWASREPAVLLGTAVTSDTYWKGLYAHKDAEFIVHTYGCPDPFAASEMEDVGIAIALERANMLDRYIILRDAVNMDVFMNGDTPDSLWNPDTIKDEAYETSTEIVDIFSTAMENNYLVGRVIIDAILDGTLTCTSGAQ